MTKIYGHSDDLIEIEGDYSGEYSSYDSPILIAVNDGTILSAHYGKRIKGINEGIWDIQVINEGPLFDRREECLEETDKGYSDIIFLKEGIKNIFAGSDFKKVK